MLMMFPFCKLKMFKKEVSHSYGNYKRLLTLGRTSQHQVVQSKTILDICVQFRKRIKRYKVMEALPCLMTNCDSHPKPVKRTKMINAIDGPPAPCLPSSFNCAILSAAAADY